ncbi:class I SAM-dependent methyltransferase [Actinomycetospora straminea]|uniref:SAM-dependent methyltransferase n=1 Tax=Actinomycetospora straminea TaxID=663607 RepID=A0ABP9E115_9PSEU|nr:class I SAM-dependent methyltransferase [Actinomycetospora straminea]MDD7931008.1 class I SAM-dependent methyltransferase [Actinomycetospora straminea]
MDQRGDPAGTAGVVVTTSKSPSDALRAEAHRLAATWGLPVVERHRGSVATARGGAATALVCTSEGLVAESASGRLAFHQGTAAKRLRTLRHGGTDPLLRAGELRPGDRVLDTTLGLGRDALVAAWALGPTGEVLGVEADLVLAILAAEGFAGAVPRPGSAPVRVRHGDSREVLTAMAAAGEQVDVVLLDPMFADPRASDHGFALARDHTVPTPLTPEWVALARAVARRRVVVTAERARPWFAEAGLERLEGTRSGRWFRARPS